MEFTFLHLSFSLLFLLVPVIWLWHRQKTHWLHRLLRAALLSMVILALMKPVLITDTSNSHHVIIVDQSASIEPEAARQALQQAENLAANTDTQDTVSVIQLGGTAWNNPPFAYMHLPAEHGSSLSVALEQALLAIPAGSRGAVTLFSHGLATDQHWGQAIAGFEQRGIPVHTYPLTAVNNDVYPVAMTVRPARVGEDVSVLVDIIGSAQGLQLVLSDEQQELARSERFSSDGRQQIELTFQATEAGFKPLSVTLIADNSAGSTQDNKRLTTVAAIQPPLSLLYMGNGGATAAQQLNTLLGKSIDVSYATADSQPDFAQYALVMTDDLPASQLSSQQQQQLASVIQQKGTGLLHSGGNAAFGPGGYANTPLAALLPVELEQNDEKSDPSVGLAIIIDTSGSMAGTRIELARQMARIAVRRLQPHDRVGIVEFYGAKHWAIPMQPASNKIEVERAISRMQAIGGTVLYPALQEAYYGLKNINTRYKHVLMITDAGVEDDDYENLIRRMAKEGINVSTILVGQGGHNQIMADMASWGKGRFYSVGNEFQLVEMILKQPATKTLAAYKTGSFALEPLTGPGWWGDFWQQQLPEVKSYVQVKTRPQAQQLLQLTQNQQPLLSYWQYGSGRVTALMTEPLSTGTAGWQQWPAYGQWLSRILAQTAGNTEPFRYHIRRQRDQIYLLAEQIRPGTQLTPDLQLTDRQLQQAQPLVFEQQAPGLFQSRFNYPAQHDLWLKTATNSAFYADAAYSDSMPQTQIDPAKKLDLEQLSVLTGGERLSQQSLHNGSVSTGEGHQAIRALHLAPWLLLLALLAYLAELVLRRWSFRFLSIKKTPEQEAADFRQRS